MAISAVFSTAALARTVIVPPPVPGPHCEATLEHGALMPVEPAGTQRFVQRAIERQPDGRSVNGFIFMDCAKGEGVGVVEPAQRAGQPDPYVIRRDTTVTALTELAAQRGDEATPFVGPPESGALTYPFCGCRVLYPDSIGAKYGN